MTKSLLTKKLVSLKRYEFFGSFKIFVVAVAVTLVAET
jgi:hypothetical protein